MIVAYTISLFFCSNQHHFRVYKAVFISKNLHFCHRLLNESKLNNLYINLVPVGPCRLSLFSIPGHLSSTVLKTFFFWNNSQQWPLTGSKIWQKRIDWLGIWDIISIVIPWLSPLIKSVTLGAKIKFNRKKLFIKQISMLKVNFLKLNFTILINYNQSRGYNKIRT